MVVTGFEVNGDLHHHSPLEELLQATLNIVLAYAWYASPHGALRFVNERKADYLGLPNIFVLPYCCHPPPSAW
jgi:hypothetical protein